NERHDTRSQSRGPAVASKDVANLGLVCPPIVRRNHAVLLLGCEIPGSPYAGTRAKTNHHRRPGGPLSLRPESDLSGVLTVTARYRDLGQQPVAAGHARSSTGPHPLRGNRHEREAPCTHIRSPVLGLQGIRVPPAVSPNGSLSPLCHQRSVWLRRLGRGHCALPLAEAPEPAAGASARCAAHASRVSLHRAQFSHARRCSVGPASCIRSPCGVWRPHRGDLGVPRAGRSTNFLGLRRRLALQHLGHCRLGLRVLQWPHWSQATPWVHGCSVLYSYRDRAATFPHPRNDVPTAVGGSQRKTCCLTSACSLAAPSSTPSSTPSTKGSVNKVARGLDFEGPATHGARTDPNGRNLRRISCISMQARKCDLMKKLGSSRARQRSQLLPGLRLHSMGFKTSPNDAARLVANPPDRPRLGATPHTSLRPLFIYIALFFSAWTVWVLYGYPRLRL